MVRKLVLVTIVASAGVAAAVRRRKNSKDDVDLWHEATTAPDLR